MPRALENYDGERRAQYARLKLEGLENAPVHVAVFADEAAEEGSGLGRRTMPETLRYSVVAAVQTLWLAARAEGLGLGWISILEPEIVCRALDVPETWTAGRLSLHRLAGGGTSRSRARSPSLAATGGRRTDDFQALSFSIRISNSQFVIASEAKQSMRQQGSKSGLLRRFAPRNDGLDTLPRSRRAKRPSFAPTSRLLKKQRAQGKPGARCTRSLVREIIKHTS